MGNIAWLAIPECVEKTTSAIDKQENTIGVFNDLKKDTVAHKILVSKLYCYGIRGLALDCINSNYIMYATQKT